MTSKVFQILGRCRKLSAADKATIAMRLITHLDDEHQCATSKAGEAANALRDALGPDWKPIAQAVSQRTRLQREQLDALLLARKRAMSL